MGLKNHKLSQAVLRKLKERTLEHSTEPKNIRKSKFQSEMEEWYANDDLEEFGPAENVEGSQQTGAEVDA